EVNVLVSSDEVSRQVQGAVKPGASDKDASEQRKAAIAAIEKEAIDKTGLRCEVVTLYNGGEYWLYRFKKYTDIRLVFAPEEQIAFFGGDLDNFTYPRYDVDFAFFRVYENGQPAQTPHFFKWSAGGAEEKELVFVPGNPGSTSRLLTLAQIEYHRDMGNPLQMQVWTSRRDSLAKYAASNAEAARRAGAQRRSLENSIKRLVGQQEGLMNPRIMGKKAADEQEFRAAVAARPDLQREYGAAWEQIAAAYRELRTMAKRLAFTSLAPSRLGTIASTLIRYSAEIGKPNATRYDEFRDSKLESLKFTLLSPAPIYADMDEALLAAWLEEGQKTLGAQDPFVRAALGTSTPSAVARAAVGGTKLADPAVRKALLDGGADAIARSDDPMIALARGIEPVIRELRAWNEQHVLSVEAAAGQKTSAARFAAYGKTVSPDATFSLRLSFGRVLGYEEDTTLIPFKTTLYGLYDRAESFNGQEPFELPARWKEGRSKLNLATPVNFVYTADTIGGNSGSPVINRRAELVGLNFDSNLQKLANRYLYIDESEGSRAVGVHSAIIIEALTRLYGAEALAREVLGK
ncbi:MAG: S46 family peptidase, partial [Acidobacteria bacterium]|nr:S46 family peptidase [Acidobacteriota bacterium]